MCDTLRHQQAAPIKKSLIYEKNIGIYQIKCFGQLLLLAGPCVIEGEEMALDIAGTLLEETSRLDIPYIFKGSYRKANRSQLDSFTGIGDEKALKILRKVRETFHIPVVTDVHTAQEAVMAAEYVDVLQIPAFLCRQTDLLWRLPGPEGLSISRKDSFITGINGFRVRQGFGFGKQRIRRDRTWHIFRIRRPRVVDMRSIPVMRSACECPVIMDITHSLQQPNSANGVTGGRPELISTIARSAIAAGADGIFMETHRNPAEAKSDGANMLPLSEARALLEQLTKLRMAVNIL